MSSVMTTISGGALAIAAASARAGGKGSRATRAVEHRPRGARGAARDAASEGDDADGTRSSPCRRRASDRPNPAVVVRRGKVTGKKTLPFQDPFETNKSIAGVGSAKDATSPFDMLPPPRLTPPRNPRRPRPRPPRRPSERPRPRPASPFGAAAPAAPPRLLRRRETRRTPAASPFADARAKAGASPFASAGAAANPFGDVKPAKAPVEDTRTAWEKLPKPAMAQVVIVLSFTTIISLMLATFWVVVQLGGVSFNDS